MSWFHGKICREEAERRLKFQGDYLVRSHGNGQFVLSCLDNGCARHLLLVDPHGQVRRARGLARSFNRAPSHGLCYGYTQNMNHPKTRRIVAIRHPPTMGRNCFCLEEVSPLLLALATKNTLVLLESQPTPI
eukprot:sb/3474983/